MSRTALIGAAAAVIVVAAGVAVVLGRATGAEQPPAPADPTGITSTRLPGSGSTYWTPERMRSAQPAPMPEDD